MNKRKVVFLITIIMIFGVILIVIGMNKNFFSNKNTPKNNNEIISIDPITTKTCESEYNLEGDTCVKYESIMATPNYGCEKSDDLPKGVEETVNWDGVNCTYTLTVDAYEQSYCMSDTKCQLDGPDVCVCEFVMPVSIIGSGIYQRDFCLDGWYRNGDNCVKYSYTDSFKRYVCPDDWYLNNGKCSRTIVTSFSLFYLTCPDGYTLNEPTARCERKIESEVIINKTCPHNYTLVGNYCEKDK